ncbi:MAG: hypothetical protein WC183_12910 [Methanosarcina sp.]
MSSDMSMKAYGEVLTDSHIYGYRESSESKMSVVSKNKMTCAPERYFRRPDGRSRGFII